MKILFEYTANKIKNIDVLKKALHIIENESMQGFFKSKGESEFKKYSDKSPLEDAKKMMYQYIDTSFSYHP